jgi:hypothetical protein
MNVLLLTSHAIAEHDDLDMFTRMGVPVYSIGGAYDDVPFEGKRPALPNVIRYPELEAATNEQRARLSHDRGDPDQRPRGGRFYVDWGKADLAPEVIDWLDTVIIHHFPEEWLELNWPKLREKRVIWRTCGQSDPRLEREMYRYARQGMQIVRYSPKEYAAFSEWGAFAGQDALIRFGKDPDEWYGWTGIEPVVGNITQDMAQRGDACGYAFWQEATQGLNTRPAGPGSEVLRGGIGQLTYERMRQYLRDIRVYLYTGTRPASYTLGLIEAMMTGTPVISMGAGAFQPPELLEPFTAAYDDPALVRSLLREVMQPGAMASVLSLEGRARAIELFGLDGVMAQWAEFLA